jgi:four helix bundle protein
MNIETYRDLRVWQQSLELAETIYNATAAWPKSELYGLTGQTRRAAISIPSNIAEGYGRESTGSYIQFLKTARGSLCELETQVEIARRIKLIDDKQSASINQEIVVISKMLSGLIRSVGASAA